MTTKRATVFKIYPQKHCALKFTLKCFPLLVRNTHCRCPRSMSLHCEHFLGVFTVKACAV